LVKSLSYEGSTILDFFAGSCITSRVAIQEKRHSIISDYDPIIYQYLEEQLKKISNDLFLEKDNYKIIHEINFKQHPIFEKI
jgi:site-specific DNA-methyltransferase (adenine-specific)